MNKPLHFNLWPMVVVFSLLTGLGILTACAPLALPPAAAPASATPAPPRCAPAILRHSYPPNSIPKASPLLIAWLCGAQVGPDEIVLTASVWSWAGAAPATTIALSLPAEVTPLDGSLLHWQVDLAKGDYFTQTVRAKVGAFSEALTFALTASFDPLGIPNTPFSGSGELLYMRQTTEMGLEFSWEYIDFGIIPTPDPRFELPRSDVTPAPSDIPGPFATFETGDKHILVLTYAARATSRALTPAP